jgi:hypothetical protein
MGKLPGLDSSCVSRRSSFGSRRLKDPLPLIRIRAFVRVIVRQQRLG